MVRPVCIPMSLAPRHSRRAFGSITLYEKRNHHRRSLVSYHFIGRLQKSAVEQFHNTTAWQQAGSSFRW